MARVVDLYQVYIRKFKSEEWRIPKGADPGTIYTHGQATRRAKRAKACGYEVRVNCVSPNGFGDGVYTDA